MTLTRIMPSLRRSIPDPLDVNLWPELTVATTTDVLVSGISLLRLVEVCGTPCVHSGASVIPGSLGRPSETHKTAVLVVRVTNVGTHASGHIVVTTDARLGELRLVWSELRLINRVSTAHTRSMLVAQSATADDVMTADLPADIRTGDLLAIPSRPIATTWALRPHPLTGTFDAGPRNADEPAGTSVEWLSHLA